MHKIDIPSQRPKKRRNTSYEIQGKEEQLTHSTASKIVTKPYRAHMYGKMWVLRDKGKIV